MNNKIVACDIDGCLNKMIYKLIEVVKNHYNVDVDDSCTDYEILERIGLTTPKDFEMFWDKHTNELHDIKAYPKAVDVLNKLRENGFKIVIITARGYDLANVTENWLKKQGFVYDDIVFCAGYKVDACLWKGANIMIEDNGKNVLALSNKGVKVLVPSYKYNEGIHHDDVIYCDDWDKIEEQINLFFKNKIID